MFLFFPKKPINLNIKHSLGTIIKNWNTEIFPKFLNQCNFVSVLKKNRNKYSRIFMVNAIKALFWKKIETNIPMKILRSIQFHFCTVWTQHTSINDISMAMVKCKTNMQMNHLNVHIKNCPDNVIIGVHYHQ